MNRRSLRWVIRRTGVIRAALCLSAAAVVAAGCANGQGPGMATDLPEEQAEISYWLDQPPTAQVTHESFDELLAAAERAARDRMFEISHADFRRGRLTTKPLVSKQALEFWRSDVVDGDSVMESSLATLRRTVQFDVEPGPDDGFVLTPRVVVERRAVPQRRVTDTSQYRAAVAGSAFHLATDDEGDQLPNHYWYAIGRDESLERALARDIERRTARKR